MTKTAQPPTIADAKALEVLRDVFGYDSFRGHQAEIIRRLTAGEDAFVLMPTGSGKSLCYQIPAMLRQGVGIIVSPLIALMENQVAALREAGVKAGMLNSSLTSNQQTKVLGELRTGKLDLLYIAPERLLTEPVLALLDEVPLALIAIDEAHCVSQWGHDFRPEYLGLSALHERYPRVPRIAVTATADERTRREIIQRLNLADAGVYVAGFDRPNIRYQIESRQNGRRQLLRFLEDEHPTDSGIVYCLSRRKTEETAQWLTEEGRKALPYHAGMTAEQRTRNQKRFLTEDGIIIVATIAFGMGIDKPDVRFVAHLDLPKSIECYYQETGRAGRDGLPANAWMVYGMADAVTQRSFIEDSDSDETYKRIARAKLDALIGLCESLGCRRQALLKYFGDTLPEPCGNCDACLNPVESMDGTLAARKVLFLVNATGQRFGSKYIVDILLGRPEPRIHQFGHHNLSGYGGGKELTDKQWSSVIRQLVSLGYLAVDSDRYGGITLTSHSKDILDKTARIDLRKEEPKRRTKEERQAKRTAALNLGPAQDLFEALRAKRKEIALQNNVPPYVIFLDVTLKAMAETRPSTLEELNEIPGIGQRKLDAYGKIFLDIIRNS